MGQYAMTTTVPRSFREDPGFDAGAAAAGVGRLGAEGHGYHPVGEPQVDWQEITQAEVDFNVAAQREAGIFDPVAPFAAGDWRVRVIFEVTEDAKLCEPRPDVTYIKRRQRKSR